MRNNKNERGMILVIATVFVMIISILVVGFMSRNSSQTLATETQIKRLQAEAILEGAMWRAQAQYSNDSTWPATYNQTVGNITYRVTFSNGAATAGPDSTMPFTANITY